MPLNTIDYYLSMVETGNYLSLLEQKGKEQNHQGSSHKIYQLRKLFFFHFSHRR